MKTNAAPGLQQPRLRLTPQTLAIMRSMAASRQEPKLTRSCSICLPMPCPAQTSRYCSRMTQTCRRSAALAPRRSLGDSMDALQHRVVACVGVRRVWQRVSSSCLRAVTRHRPTRRSQEGPPQLTVTDGPRWRAAAVSAAIATSTARALRACGARSPSRLTMPARASSGTTTLPGLSELPAFP